MTGGWGGIPSRPQVDNLPHNCQLMEVTVILSPLTADFPGFHADGLAGGGGIGPLLVAFVKASCVRMLPTSSNFILVPSLRIRAN